MPALICLNISAVPHATNGFLSTTSAKFRPEKNQPHNPQLTLMFCLSFPNPANSRELADEEGGRGAVEIGFPGVEAGFEVVEEGLVLVAEVAAFADVVFEVEEEIDAAIEHVFPVAVADGFLLAGRAVDAPAKGAFAGLLLAGEDGEEVEAVEVVVAVVVGVAEELAKVFVEAATGGIELIGIAERCHLPKQPFV